MTGPRCNVPPVLQGEVLRLWNEGKYSAQIAKWLREEHGIVISDRQIRALRVRRLRRQRAAGWVYAVQPAGEPDAAVKIGFTRKDPAHRCRTLQTGHQSDLVVLCAVTGVERDERQLHRMFAKWRLRRGWFAYDGEVRAWVERHRIPPLDTYAFTA